MYAEKMMTTRKSQIFGEMWSKWRKIWSDHNMGPRSKILRSLHLQLPH
jgi:hypothetical protein